VALDPHGARIASGSYDGAVLVWETAGAAERFLAQRAAALVEERLAAGSSPAGACAAIAADTTLAEDLRREALLIAGER
jgi:hypothetical protein